MLMWQAKSILPILRCSTASLPVFKFHSSMMATDRRLSTLKRHLMSAPAGVDPREVYLWLTRDNVELRDQMLDFLKDPLYKPQYHLSLKDFRALTLERLARFTEQRFFRAIDYLEDPLKFLAGMEVATFVDYSLSIKAGVHFTLCGGSLCNLGTQKHHDAFLPGLDTLEERGCFAMTELGHGSNVMGIETTAVYDPSTESFILHTPTNTASKFWIGGAGTDATISTVFAQLTVDGKWQGPHVFVVRLREKGHTLPGIRIKDNGHKAGLNGVDNGQIWFDHVRVPRDALLDKYASVTRDGTYSSPISSVGTRFGTMVGGLTGGRILIGQGAIDAAKMGVTIALRYACMRPQFENKLIITYLTHQRRLLPSLATTFALHLAMLRVKELYVRKDPKQAKLLHVMSSGLKAGATWSRGEILQLCREACGGQGFLSQNKIGPMKNDMDVDQTFEGDNSVMMQQVTKALLETATRTPPRPATPSVADSGLLDHSVLLQLLKFREEAQTLEIATATRKAAGAAASSGSKASAAAASEAYEENIDTAVALGWSYVERIAFQAFSEDLSTAPVAATTSLRQLATLYGLTRVERGMAFFLASGALQIQQAAAVRRAVNALCRQLVADGGKAMWALCDGFGIPDELLHAPIAFDWTVIGSGDREL